MNGSSPKDIEGVPAIFELQTIKVVVNDGILLKFL
jgi:hypothetical protein